MNLYILNQPKVLEISKSYIVFEKDGEPVRVKLSKINNVVVFNELALKEDLLSVLKDASIFYLDKSGSIYKYTLPKIRGKILNEDMKNINLIVEKFLISVLAVAKRNYYFKITTLPFLLVGFNKEMDILRYGCGDKQECIQKQLLKLLMEMKKISDRSIHVLFAGGIEEEKRVLVRNYLHSFLVIFTNTHLIENRIKPDKEIQMLTQIGVNNAIYPHLSYLLTFPFIIDFGDIIYDLLYYILEERDFEKSESGVVVGLSSEIIMVISKIFNMNYTYSTGNISKINSIIKELS